MPSTKKAKPEDEIPQADAQFIVQCVVNMTPDRQVDLNRVASALGYGNVASTANRFRLLRKRYGFELEATQTGSPIKAKKTLTEGNDVLDAQNNEDDPGAVTPTKRKAPAKGTARKKVKANQDATADLDPSDEAEAESEVDTKPNPKGRKKNTAARPKAASKVEVVVEPETMDKTDITNEVV
ncbi:uncharacterized protein BO97DRAFT_452444 [Aspergillus homomorphus CBS 101889]|uniref:Uncharacterized protein n=1 Tax=Aspergillus homomorphus (strain CBS 101889) TaxID=1450537 RepID=A0A395HW77_ASPHC|nr:hypothetical protein BO97DRAFT_452444 [Aspergillus homomorphus CBS 101889]RAL12060.1 hypothetical protein BO97DRAFT_452444 [Aspergillus homomorphus CBS 101889]